MRTYLSKSIIRQIAVVSVAVLFIFAYTTAYAQERSERSERCEGGICAEASFEVSTKTKESASNDSPESAEPRCEGGQCPKEEADTQRAPVAGGGDCDDTDREVTPGVCNDEGDVESAAAGGGYNSSRSNKPRTEQAGDGDIDEEADRIAPAQDYNTSRSNKPSSIRDDGDDQTTPYLWQSLRPVGGVEPEDADSDDDGLSDGEESSSSSAARGFIKFGDIKGEVRVDEETGTPRLSQVAVAARDVRNWTEEDRAAFTALRQAVASNTPEAASLRITQQLLDDDQIEEIAVNETESRVRYRANLRLFGFIPVEREVEATAQADGEVVVDYPWYSFLATKPDTERIRSILLDVQEKISGAR